MRCVFASAIDVDRDRDVCVRWLNFIRGMVLLKQRVITALILLAVVLPCMFVSTHWPFVLLVSIAVTLAAWEWARLQGMEAISCKSVAGLFALFLVLALSQQWHIQVYSVELWVVISVVWFLLAVWILHKGVPSWGRLPQDIRLMIGLWILATTWLAVLVAYQQGVNFLLSILALVWAADIGAYFAGRSVGQKIFSRKLAPAISPGKSWEGVFGGMLAVVAMAFFWVWFDRQAGADWSPSLYSLLLQKGPVFMVLGCVLLAGLSVMGDLQESLVKRSAGMKDSSQLLPGHGGVLDRIDGLLPAVPAAIMLMAFATN